MRERARATCAVDGYRFDGGGAFGQLVVFTRGDAGDLGNEAIIVQSDGGGGFGTLIAFTRGDALDSDDEAIIGVQR